MGAFDCPVAEIIAQRYSCRAYDKTPIAPEQAAQLTAFAEAITRGPLGAPLRFDVAVARRDDPQALRGLGTYGFVKDPAGFIIGAVGPGVKNLEDFGYGMEAVVFHATSLGLGTCWLGGSFKRSRFARRIRASGAESVPAVVATGYAVEGIRTRDRLRRVAGSDSRLPWEALFFRSRFGSPLPEAGAGPYAAPLAMLRLAPSASNRQPWRLVQDGARYHFYLQRTHRHGPGTLASRLLGIADLQRVDMGIAMCHFELTARELGLAGEWVVDNPDGSTAAEAPEYVVTWVGQGDDDRGLRGTERGPQRLDTA